MKNLSSKKVATIASIICLIIAITSTVIMSKSHHSFQSTVTSVNAATANQLKDTADSTPVAITAEEKQLKEHDDLMEKTRLFNDELKQLLLKDGYIKDVNNIECVSYGADGIVKVCGAKITRADKKKYQALHHKYFNRGHFSETKTE